MLYESVFRKLIKSKLNESAPTSKYHAVHVWYEKNEWKTGIVDAKNIPQGYAYQGKSKEGALDTANSISTQHKIPVKEGWPKPLIVRNKLSEEIHPSKGKVPPASMTGRAKYIKKKSRSLGRAVYGRYHEEKKVNLKKGQSHVTINPTLDDKPVL